MSSAPLDPLLRPRSIAVIGASLTDRLSVGARTAHVLRRHSGRPVHVVHPRAASSEDPAVVPTLADLPEVVDLLVVAVPAPKVVGVVREAADLGIRSVLVFTSGFAEGGADGQAAQEQIREIVAETGLLVSGPNTMGYINAHEGLLATFFLPLDAELPPAGPVAIASQSGALATYIDEMARDRGIDPGWLVTTGNEAGVEVTDVLAYLVEQPEVHVLTAILEGLRDGEAFIEVAARAAELGKPFVVVKAGRSSAGQAAAMSHTASWKATPGAAHYRVQYSTDPSMKNAKYADVAAPSTSLTVKGLAAGTRYHFRVAAVEKNNGAKASDYTQDPYASVVTAARANPGGYPYAIPAALTTSGATTSSLKVSWAPVSGAPHYRVQYSTDPSMKNAKYANTTGTSLTLEGLAARTRYHVRIAVVAKNNGGKLSDYTQLPYVIGSTK